MEYTLAVTSPYITFKPSPQQQSVQAAPKEKENMTIMIFYLVVSQRLWVFVFRKLDEQLWTEHTISVTDSKLVEPQGGIKYVMLFRPRPGAKMRTRAQVKWTAST